MKAKGLALLLAAALLFTGCTTRPLSFTLNKAGCYTGFSDIEETYSREAAARYGYLVRWNFELEDNGELWEDFLRRAAQGKRASIRIASFYEEGVSFADLFYRDGKYRVFFSDSQDLLDQPYSCLLILSGRASETSEENYVAVLTDDPDLTYEAVMSRFSSSVLFEGEEIAMYEIVFLGVGEL